MRPVKVAAGALNQTPLDWDGNVLGETGGQGKTLGRYGEAHYIAVSQRGEVFVTDTLNWRVQKYVKKSFSRA